MDYNINRSAAIIIIISTPIFLLKNTKELFENQSCSVL